MAPAQLLLFPDPRPLVERLGADFFRTLPERPGVYLMRDEAGAILYVGKALNLRKRLCSYRVANPDRMPSRHLRLLRAVAQIDFEECADEQAALATEGRLLRSLRPHFNRAGTWRPAPKLLAWRMTGTILEFAVLDEDDDAWQALGLSSGAWRLQNALARLVWRAANQDRSLAELPHGWICSNAKERRAIDCGKRVQETRAALRRLLEGEILEIAAELLSEAASAFDAATTISDLQTVAHALDHLRAARRSLRP